MLYESGYLMHYGISGQKWGVRRFQEPNGTLTPEGRKRYLQDKAERKAKEAESDSYYRKQAEKEGKKSGEAWRFYAESETKNAKKAIKIQNKLNKLLPDDLKKDMRKTLMDKGVEVDRFTKSALRKANNEAWKSVFKDDHPTNGKINDAFDKSLDKSESKKTSQAFKQEQDKLKRRSDELLNKNYDLEKKLIDLDKKGDHSNDQKIIDEMTKNRQERAKAWYENCKSQEAEYRQEIKKETDLSFVDPSMRTFNSKEEKAKAEADYLKKMWGWNTPDNKQFNDNPIDQKKWEREVDHLSRIVTGLSMDGYFGEPKSERQKAEFNYIKNDNVFDESDNWEPKYKQSSEWKRLQTMREQLKKMSGCDEALKKYREKEKEGLTPKQEWRLHDAWYAAMSRYEKMVKARGIDKKERKMKDVFNERLLKNILLDIGYEDTPENRYYIKDVCWYD